MSYLSLSKTPDPVIEDPEILVALNNLRRYEDRRPIIALPLPFTFLSKEQKFALYQRILRETRYHRTAKELYPNYEHKIILNKTEYKLHEENKKRLENSLNQLQYLPFKSIAHQDKKYYFPKSNPSRTQTVFVTDTDCRYISAILQSTCNSVTTITASHSFHLCRTYNEKLSQFNPHRTSSPVHFDPNGTSGTGTFDPIFTPQPIEHCEKDQEILETSISIFPQSSTVKPSARRSLYPDLTKMSPPRSVSPKNRRGERTPPITRTAILRDRSPSVTPPTSPNRLTSSENSPVQLPFRSPSISPIKTNEKEKQLDPLASQLDNLNLTGLMDNGKLNQASGLTPLTSKTLPISTDFSKQGAIPKLTEKQRKWKRLIDDMHKKNEEQAIEQQKQAKDNSIKGLMQQIIDSQELITNDDDDEEVEKQKQRPLKRNHHSQ